MVKCPRCGSRDTEPCFRKGFDYTCSYCSLMFDLTYPKESYIDHLHSNDPKDIMLLDDNVNHPDHYQGDIETIDYIKDKLTDKEFRGFCKGNALKYISRERLKNGDEDLEKARWYLEAMLEVE